MSDIEWKRDVCRACYSISADKSNQRLTTRSFARGDGVQHERFNCLKCGIQFTGINVARLPHTRWFEVRDPPVINHCQKYEMCRAHKRKECKLGKDCKYAHNQVEFAAWVGQKQDHLIRKPPPIPAKNYKLCVDKIKKGLCEADWECLFAHGEMELDSWKKAKDGTRFPRELTQPLKDLKSLKMCNFIASNRRCRAGMSCNFAHSSEELHLWKEGPPVRPCPRNAPRTNEYRLCTSVMKGKKCVYGRKCIFAHSEKELCDWNAIHRSRVFDSGLDFAVQLRSKVSNLLIQKYDKQQELHEKVDFELASETPMDLTLALSSHKEPEWMFKLTAKVSLELHSIVLKDCIADFTIDGIFKTNGQLVKSFGQAKVGKGELVKQKMAVGDIIFVKIILKPRFGVLKQTVIFDFNEICWIEDLNVTVVKNKADEDYFLNHLKLDSKQETPLSREHHKEHLRDDRSNISALPYHFFHEEADAKLPEYTLSSSFTVVDFTKLFSGDQELELTEDNYDDFMIGLLKMEETCQNLSMDRYTIHDQKCEPRREFTFVFSGLEVAPDGYYFLQVMVDEVLFEGRRSIRNGDGAYLKPKQSKTIYECKVHRIQESSIILVISGNAKEACVASSGLCWVEFFITRVHMRTMCHAVESVNLNILFPKLSSLMIDNDNAELASSKILKLDDSQMRAVVNILSPTFKQIPTIILGPFGCGKTHTMTQCIKLLAQDTDDKMLVCTRSNSAADIYVELLDEEFKGQPPNLFRLNYSQRNVRNVNSTVMKYSRLRQHNKGGNFEIPPLADIQNYQIVVSTLSTSRLLKLSELERGHFAYIFIDEAAQVLEAECIIPLLLADAKTKIVLAGDYMQIEPSVFSEDAKEYGLKKSLLERLNDHAEYHTELGQLCKIVLTANYRSHPQITDLLAKMFYKEIYQDDIISTRVHEHDEASDSRVKFIDVPGTESKEMDSPSMFNLHEAFAVAEEIENLTLRGTEVCVLTVYSKQVQMIKRILKYKHLTNKVDVQSVENVQGKQYPVVIISTVRTCSSNPENGDTDEFLNNPKLLNTALSRAQEYVIVVGNKSTLCSVGANCEYWNLFISECHSNCVEGHTPSRNMHGDSIFKPEERHCQAEHPTSKQPNKESFTPSQDCSLRPLKFIHRKDIAILEEGELGRGSYGCVKKVEYKKKTYAAKFFRDDAYITDNKLFEKLFEKFQIEARILSNLRHQNIVQYVGMSFMSGPILVMELLASNLHQYLENKPGLSILQQCCFLHDISKGLKYLHTCNVIHRDLTAKNVLLDGKHVAKISDFGNSCISDIESSSSTRMEAMTAYPGTRVYCAPETHDPGRYDNKIDIFSFGHLSIFVIIEEWPGTLTARAEEMPNGQLRTFTEIERRGKYMQKVVAKSSHYHGHGDNIVSLIKKCLQYTPSKRPSASEVEATLKTLRSDCEKLEVNNPILLPDSNSGNNNFLASTSERERIL